MSAGNTELEMGRGMANPEQNTREGLGWGREEVVDRETHTDWATVHSCPGCALHKGLTVLEIMDLYI